MSGDATAALWALLLALGIASAGATISNGALTTFTSPDYVTGTQPTQMVFTFQPATAITTGGTVTITASTAIFATDATGLASSKWSVSDAGGSPGFSSVDITGGSTSVVLTVNSGSIAAGADTTVTLNTGALGVLPAAGAVRFDIAATANTQQSSITGFRSISAPTILLTPSSTIITNQPTSLRIVFTSAVALPDAQSLQIVFNKAVLLGSITSGFTLAGTAISPGGTVFTYSTAATASSGTVTLSKLAGVMASGDSLDLTLPTSAMAQIPADPGAVTVTIIVNSVTVVNAAIGFGTITGQISSGAVSSFSTPHYVTGAQPTQIVFSFLPQYVVVSGNTVTITASVASFAADGAVSASDYAISNAGGSPTIGSGAISSSSTVVTLTLSGGTIATGGAATHVTLNTGAIGVLGSAGAVTFSIATTNNNVESGITGFTVIASPTITLNPSSTVMGTQPTSLAVTWTTPFAVADGQTIVITANKAIFNAGVTTGFPISGTAVSSGSTTFTYVTSTTAVTFTKSGGTMSTGHTLVIYVPTAALATLPSPGTVTLDIVQNSVRIIDDATGFGLITGPILNSQTVSIAAPDMMVGSQPTSLVLSFEAGTQVNSGGTLTITASTAIFKTPDAATTAYTVSDAGGSPTFSGAAISGSGTIITWTLNGGSIVINSATTVTLTTAALATFAAAGAVTFSIEATSNTAQTGVVGFTVISGATITLSSPNMVMGTQPDSLRIQWTSPTPLAEGQTIVFTANKNVFTLGQSIGLTVAGTAVSAGGAAFTYTTAQSTVTLTKSGGTLVAGHTLDVTLPKVALATLPTSGGAVTISIAQNSAIVISPSTGFGTILGAMGSLSVTVTPSECTTGTTPTSMQFSFESPTDLAAGQSFTLTFTASQAIFASGAIAVSGHSALFLSSATASAYSSGQQTLQFTVKSGQTATAGVYTFTISSSIQAHGSAGDSVSVSVVSDVDTYSATVVNAWSIIAVVVASDPITFWNGDKTKFWLPNGEFLPVLKTPEMTLFAKTFPGHTVDLQWFDCMAVVLPGGSEAVRATIKRPAAGSNHSRSRPGEFSQLEIRLGDKVLKRLQSQLYSVAGGLVRFGAGVQHGHRARLHSSSTQMEYLHVETASISFVIYGSHAGTDFPDDVDLQAKYSHLDLHVMDIRGVDRLGGILPEIWGLQPRSPEVESMLIPPSQAAAAGVCSGSNGSHQEAECGAAMQVRITSSM
eukprot:TRINITY_DN15088_c0_g1_i1.p1 TRINITY_DN15088_c0_g1~~TRINITY_DN15088_c0_g1_i1.p1  ORF type:complete len:1217 (-),score=139.46 TRINITY_DN15088_c0_g1_i1:45-3695(-)